MTHDEASELLPIYALGALEDATELEDHLDGCARCTRELASYLETTAELAGGVKVAVPPSSLRESVLAAVSAPKTQASDSPRRGLLPFRPPRAFSWSAVAALLIVSFALGAGNVAQQVQLQSSRSELTVDQRGLDLLTSTETANERLNPVAPMTDPAHGHWFHQKGQMAQVVVVEFLPAPPAGEAYYGWLRHADGSWQVIGPFTINATGYGRLILLGDDGSTVRSVEVTRQARPTAAPSGVVVLRWP